MLELTINGKPVSAPEGVTLLQCAKLAGVKIPTLCSLPGIHTNGSCRICVVEVEGQKNLMASCIVKAQNGMVVKTNSERVRKARKILYDLVISSHPKDCMSCGRNQSCELQELGYTLDISTARIPNKSTRAPIDISPAITRDPSKCILCRRCVTACNDIQGVGAIGSQNRGFETTISPAMDLPLLGVNCAMCGQCSAVCPTGAIVETDHIGRVWAALSNPSKRVAVQVAPAVRAALGEEFGMEAGTRVTGRLASALRELGFDDVFDTNFAADLTIMEEGAELLRRLQAALTGEGAVLPMLTSCSPGWIKHIEHAFPGQLDHLSTCKSPHMMLGALIKSCYAEKLGAEAKDFFVVSVMPCTAKKYEIQRPEMQNNGYPNVDAVITTRELGRMIKSAGIDFAGLQESDFDAPLGFSTGAADIFGVTGGVMEAALRTVYELATGRELPSDNLHLTPIMGLDSIKEAALKFEDVKPEYGFLEGVTARVAVASGLKNADVLMHQVEDGASPYHFIEIMGCPSGCINGGGQPRMAGKPEDYKVRRMKAIYAEDESKALRKSHENPDVLALYKDYLGEPGGHVSHRLLHTTYTERGNFNELIAT
ncbi:NAD(P)-dependent iron-only hydrogenase catalytic subunit [Sporobacter termitidis DSM 10068]|uniref:NAD(P)-dependent iron-only hydrogenase catalytic subunit n=1 Tax=Sporobacter termitidis DSM 10068 TaxID=1123282 RepID=A0A1M5WTQ3_9FIRM|nr:NADH-dependent [FeFe] hydrogenase, group A6 [Sporobacter termitidis]SHH90956.1 NAD(P)-dependent iron-only hydrogenase catalytic subunit [Sporobacter termitidis DSM 10068]